MFVSWFINLIEPMKKIQNLLHRWF